MYKILHSLYRSAGHRSVRRDLWLFLVLTVLFLGLTAFVVSERSDYWDLHVSAWLQNRQGEMMDAVMKGFSWLGSVPIAFCMICTASLFFLVSGKKREALLIFSTVLTGAVSWTLKMLINRSRPGTDFVRVIEETHYQSFPSGHVLFYTVFFGLLSLIVYHNRKLSRAIKAVCISIFALTLIFGAVSRIYLGAHWFTDILGGMILGMAFLLLARLAYLKKWVPANNDQR